MSRLTRPAELDDLLLLRISRLLATGGAAVIRLCEGRYGITRREWRLLALAVRCPGLLSSQLAERAHLDRARTSRAITSLVAKKLVRRTPQAGDRRQVVLEATDAGRALFADLFPQVQAINARLLAGLAPDDAERLDAVLDQLQAQADAIALQGEPLPKADRRRGQAGRVAG